MKYDYYVYGVFDSCDKLVYIGKGIGDRLNMHCKGGSSNPNLNSIYFSGEALYSKKLIDGLSENQALFKEAQLIYSLNPEANTVIPRITKELSERAFQDEKSKPFYRREEEPSEYYSYPLVNTLRSPNYTCMKDIRFPCKLPLKWCGNHYRIFGEDLIKLGCDLPEDMQEKDSLCIPNHCFT